MAKQIIEYGHEVAEVSARIGLSQHGLYKRIKAGEVPQASVSQAEELRRLKAELKRVTEERDIRKRPQRTLPSSLGEVRVHQGPQARAQAWRMGGVMQFCLAQLHSPAPGFLVVDRPSRGYFPKNLVPRHDEEENLRIALGAIQCFKSQPAFQVGRSWRKR